MADKSDYVDLISDATRQNRRRAMPVDIEPMPSAAARESRMAHTPPRLERWRMETLTPWKIRIKSWKFVNWD